MRILEHARIESAKDVGGIVLCIGATDGGFERRSEIMSKEGVCGTSEAGSVEGVKDGETSYMGSTCPNASMSCSIKSP